MVALTVIGIILMALGASIEAAGKLSGHNVMEALGKYMFRHGGIFCAASSLVMLVSG
jgi:hypothetical protein